MPFGLNKFKSSSSGPFDRNQDKNFGKLTSFEGPSRRAAAENPFDTTRKPEEASEIRFYNQDSLWSRWRRGFELYSITQSTLGSLFRERKARGDYRLYFSFQQFPGIFVPARLFTYPSASNEIGEQLVGMRDTNAFSFYDIGIPIDEVRYLSDGVSGTYTQSGTTITVTKSNHNYFIGDEIYLDFTTGSATDDTLAIVSRTQNTFTLTAASSATTSGNVTYYLSTTFTDTRWTNTRVKLRELPEQVSLLKDERMTDRIIERDPGIDSTYSRLASTVTVTTSSAHGLATGNKIFLDVSTGDVPTGRYSITVTSTTTFTFLTITSSSTSGNAKVNRLVRGFDYTDYVGFTVTGSDATTKEIIFQRKDSYGAKTISGQTATVVPAHRGFTVGRYLTTELRWQCTCQDYTKRKGYNLFKDRTKNKFPVTPVQNLSPGQTINKNNELSDSRDNPGVFEDFGYTTVNNFYQIPEYEDTEEFASQTLLYYQPRWCKHIYASMWALIHDEGGQPISLSSSYTQSGPNITINAVDHNLEQNQRVKITFTSGSAISGDYVVSSVTDSNTFVIVYPFTDTTSGYCDVANLAPHEYVGTWLLEPSDQPVGKGLETFYKNFEKESIKLKEAAEKYVLDRQFFGWAGTQNIIGQNNNPEDVADFRASAPSMLLTDDIRRNAQGLLDRAGTVFNTTSRFAQLVNKLFNLQPEVIENAKFGLIDQPLSEYTDEFEQGFVEGGEYLSGVPTESTASVVTIEASTYSPLTDQDRIVDAGTYINI